MLKIVNRDHLYIAVQNSLLFCNQKSWTKAHVLLVGKDSNLSFWSTDNFIVAKTFVPGIGDPTSNWQASVSKKDLQTLKERLENTDEIIKTVRVQTFDNKVVFDTSEEDLDKLSLEAHPVAFEWPHVIEMYESAAELKSVNDSFAIAPDRVRKFSLLKAEKEYPVDFRVVHDKQGVLVRWQYGPALSGLIVPLEREVVEFTA
jgi:hypothetical protein